jgi:hypothetical protein
MQVFGEYLRDAFYAIMLILLMDPSPYYNLKTVVNDPKQLFKKARAEEEESFHHR